MLKTAPELFRFIAFLRQERYDTVLDLQGLLRSGLMSFLSGAPLRVGFENAREWAPIFYNHKVPVPNVQIHAIERYQLFLLALGLDVTPVDYGLNIPDSAQSRLEEKFVKAGLHTGKPLVVINPNARWETKRWLPERFAALADRLVAEAGAEVVFIGSPSEAPAVRQLASQSRKTVGNLAGATSLMELAALLKQAHLVISCDSGPMHLAAAVGTRVLALFGPTDPLRTGPYGSGHRVIQKSHDCSPCLKRDCPEAEQRCMNAIMMEEVYSEATDFLSTVRSGARGCGRGLY